MSLLQASELDAALESVPRQLLIGGRWVDAASGKTFGVVNPSTGEELLQVAEGGAEDVDAAVAAARRAYESSGWRRMSPAERQRILWRIADVMEEHAEELATLETLDVGKPLKQLARGRRAARDRVLPLHGRLGHAPGRQDRDALAARRMALLHDARAGRRRRRDRARGTSRC